MVSSLPRLHHRLWAEKFNVTDLTFPLDASGGSWGKTIKLPFGSPSRPPRIDMKELSLQRPRAGSNGYHASLKPIETF